MRFIMLLLIALLVPNLVLAKVNTTKSAQPRSHTQVSPKKPVQTKKRIVQPKRSTNKVNDPTAWRKVIRNPNIISDRSRMAINRITWNEFPGMQPEIKGFRFAGEYTGGGPNDLNEDNNVTRMHRDTASVIAHDLQQPLLPNEYVLAIGASDTMGYYKPLAVTKISDMYNLSSLPHSRGNDANVKAEFKLKVASETIPYDRRGTYYVWIKLHPPLGRDSIHTQSLSSQPGHDHAPVATSGGWSVEPLVGYSILGNKDANYHTPIVGLSLTKGRGDGFVALRGFEGRRFAEKGDNQVWGGEIQAGSGSAWSAILGAVGFWRLDPSYHYQDRYVMLHIGPAWRLHSGNFFAEIHGGVGYGNFDDATENVWQPGATAKAYAFYRF